MTQNALIETRRANDRLISADACCVKLRNTNADPGGLTIGKRAARTNRKVSTKLYPSVRRRNLWEAIPRPTVIGRLFSRTTHCQRYERRDVFSSSGA